MILDKAALMEGVAARTLETKDVPCPELGGDVRVSEMVGHVRNRFEMAMVKIEQGSDDGAGLDMVTAHMLAGCILGDDGRPMLTVNDAKRILKQAPRVAFRLRDAIIKLSALDDEDAEQMAQGFETAQGEGSTSA